jgi:tetraacyldisaccharide 4'-kinase
VSERAVEDGVLGGAAGAIGAWVYARGVAFARARALRGPRVRTRRPLVSVGNLVVGGTGKTPCTAWLANRLEAEGREVAVVARPVGDPVPGAEGDELAVLAELAPRAQVFAARDKSQGALRADKALGESGVIVVDDAFSHWRLERDLDVVLLHAPRPIGNGHLLPLGPLREPPGALARAGVVILTRADRLDADELARTRAAVSSLAPSAVVAAARLAPGAITLGGSGAELAIPPRQRAVCVSAIARRGELARAAGSLGIEVVEDLGYPDHHRFRAGEWSEARGRADRHGAWLLVTRKDAVRLEPAERAHCHVLDVRFELLDGESEVLTRIREVLR